MEERQVAGGVKGFSPSRLESQRPDPQITVQQAAKLLYVSLEHEESKIIVGSYEGIQQVARLPQVGSQAKCKDLHPILSKDAGISAWRPEALTPG